MPLKQVKIETIGIRVGSITWNTGWYNPVFQVMEAIKEGAI